MKTAKIKAIVPFAVILLISLAAEAVMANFVYFSYVAGKTDFQDFSPENVNGTVITEDNDTLSIRDVGFQINSVSMTLSVENAAVMDSLAKAVFYVADEGNGGVLSSVYTDRTAVGNAPRRTTFYLNSKGASYGIDIKFSSFTGDITVSDVILNPKYEFSFNALRFAAVFIILLVFYILKYRGVGKSLREELNFKDAAINSVAVCVAFSAAFWALCASSENGNYIAYPLEGDISVYSPYVQQFDAFLKGQLYLDVQPSEELLALENPYSPAARADIECLFDRALFEGKYYSYFGVAPIILVYLPFYLVFGGLPTDSTVTGIFSLMTAFFLPLAVIEWAKIREKIRPWLSALLAVAVYFASCVLMIQRGRAQFYYIAGIAGMAFSAAFLFFMMKYISAKKAASKIILLFFAGLSFALGFLSRLNSVVPVGLAAAAFVVIYIIKSIKNRKIGAYIGEMAALGVPVAAAVGFSLWYNNARFGDPLQFGTDYQLTVTDTSFYELSTAGIFPSILHYFFQPFSFSEIFPYIGINRTVLSDYGKYVYIDANFGIFAYPIMLALFFVPVLLKNKKFSANGKALLSVSVFSLFLTAFVNFCMGGAIFRYTADIALFAAFISAVVLGELCGMAYDNHGGVLASHAVKTAAAVSVLTIIIGFFASIIINGNFVTYSPDFYVAMEDFFVFWN